MKSWTIWTSMGRRPLRTMMNCSLTQRMMMKRRRRSSKRMSQLKTMRTNQRSKANDVSLHCLILLDQLPDKLTSSSGMKIGSLLGSPVIGTGALLRIDGLQESHHFIILPSQFVVPCILLNRLFTNQTHFPAQLHHNLMSLVNCEHHGVLLGQQTHLSS